LKRDLDNFQKKQKEIPLEKLDFQNNQAFSRQTEMKDFENN
jgi:hypothetical protein